MTLFLLRAISGRVALESLVFVVVSVGGCLSDLSCQLFSTENEDPLLFSFRFLCDRGYYPL